MTEYYIDPDITLARTLDSSFYTNPEVFEISKEKIFSSCWHFAGSKDLLNGQRNAHPFTVLEKFLDEPLLLLKASNGETGIFSNVCTHRGNILIEKPCNAIHIRCRYHGRLFNLDGQCMSMPEFKEVKGFPDESDNLKKLPVFQWENLIFTSLSEKINSEIFFNDMMQRVKWMPLNDFVFHPELSRDFNVKAHWALYCENYLEGFHIPFVHAGLNAVIDYGEYATELFFPYSNLQIGIAKNNEFCFDLPESSPDYGKNIAAYYFWIFPNMMFNFYPWGLSLNIVKPVSINECKVSFLSYVWDQSKLHEGAGAELDKVEKEDEEIVENVQRGIFSRFYKNGRYSATREKGTHHFHRILADFMK